MKAEDAGLVWYKDELRYFTDYRRSIRGKHKGTVRVLIEGKYRRVPETKVRRWPNPFLTWTQEA
jgi:hypothetical protein